jgi:hypothetical protein
MFRVHPTVITIFLVGVMSSISTKMQWIEFFRVVNNLAFDPPRVNIESHFLENPMPVGAEFPGDILPFFHKSDTSIGIRAHNCAAFIRDVFRTEGVLTLLRS